MQRPDPNEPIKGRGPAPVPGRLHEGALPTHEDVEETIMATATNKHGIQETVEFIQGLRTLGVKVIEEVKDGLDVSDLMDVVMDADVRQAVGRAVKGIESVPKEAADANLDEAKEVLHECIELGVAIFAAIKAKAKSSS